MIVRKPLRTEIRMEFLKEARKKEGSNLLTYILRPSHLKGDRPIYFKGEPQHEVLSMKTPHEARVVDSSELKGEK